MPTNTLTSNDIEKARREAKAASRNVYRFDGGRMFLLAKPNGSALWRLKYKFNSVEKLISLGAFPDVPLKLARERRDEARKLVEKGIDPGALRRAAKLAHDNTVKTITEEYFTKRKHELAPATYNRDHRLMEKLVWPYLGTRPIATVIPKDLLDVLQRIEARGDLVTAKKTRSLCGRIWRYAVATARAERDISQDLTGAIANNVVRHLAAITDPKRVGELLRAIFGYEGQPTVTAAFRLAPYVFVRPGELRTAEWKEFDFDAATWTIPGHKMKMRQDHVVPLSSQAVAILREVELHSGGQRINGEPPRYVFPSLRGAHRPMSENTLAAALKVVGYTGDVHTVHGFRATARTILDEVLHQRPDFIEHQLAHAVKDPNGRAYNRTAHLDERRKMMQMWADYLDTLRAGGNVVPIRKNARTAS